jgi:hypothetical protein
MKLSGKQIGEIQDALLDAYPDRDALRMMVRIELEENLESIADGSNQRVVIFNLINWADRVGCVDALIQGAYRQNDGNFALQRLMESWRATERPATDRTSFSRFPQTLAGRASVNIFLCYSRKDSGVMRKVKESLRDAGLVVWTDEGLEPGTPAWQDAIEDAANQAQAMVVLLSPNAKKSQWVKNEVSFAQTQGKRVFPLLVDGNERNSIPIDLINTQWVDGRRQVEVVVRQSLLPAIQKSIYGSVPPPLIVSGNVPPVAVAWTGGCDSDSPGCVWWLGACQFRHCSAWPTYSRTFCNHRCAECAVRAYPNRHVARFTHT